MCKAGDERHALSNAYTPPWPVPMLRMPRLQPTAKAGWCRHRTTLAATAAAMTRSLFSFLRSAVAALSRHQEALPTIVEQVK